MSVAYTLWCCGGSRSVAIVCVTLSAFGRMYWQAHHLLDVLGGALTSLLTCNALHLLLRVTSPDESGSSTCPQATWWHPGLALVALWLEQQILKVTRGRANKHP